MPDIIDHSQILGVTAFCWKDNHLIAVFPPVRTFNGEEARFWMTESEARVTIRQWQKLLHQNGKEMEPIPSEDYITD